MNCPQCGAMVPEGAKQCPSCSGAIVRNDTNATWSGATSGTTAKASAGDDVTIAGFTRHPAAASDVLTPPPGFSESRTPSANDALWMSGSDAPTFGVGANDGTAAPFNRGPMSPNAPTSASWLGAAAAPALGGPIDFGPRYRVERLLGQGGMGAVYLAYDQDLGRSVALKLVKPELMVHPEAMARFRQELLLASKISHRNILRIHDLGDAAGMKFISMAFVDGEDLHHLLMREGKLPLERMLHITRQLCAALDAAHSEGVVHRDLKPQNIMLGANDHVYVSDFGLAKSLGAVSSMTQSGEMLGTPRYMAPEQVEAKSVDARTDIYSLGLIFYEMVTGDVPFTAETTLQLMYKRAHETPPAPKTVVPDLPDWLNNVIMKCLERDPANRYQSTHDILADIDAQRKPELAPVMQTVPTAFPQVAATHASSKVWTGIVAAVIVVLAGLLMVPQIRHALFKGTGTATVGNPKPVTILVADIANHTGDPVFDGTLEPMFNVALEGASFINAYNRGEARKVAQKLPTPADKLDEATARLVAVSQGINAVVIGSLSRRGDGYKLSVDVVDTITGNTLASDEVTPASKDEVLREIPKLVAPMRKALGDATPESAQLAAAQGTFAAANLEAVHLYGMGMEQQFLGKLEDALQSFGKAVQLDPEFARAYSGMAAVSGNIGRLDDADKYVKLAMEHVDRMTEREKYRIRGLYYLTVGDYPKCIEEYSTLLNLYPADNLGHNNLARCYGELRKMPKAVEEMRRAVEIAPNGAVQRMNLALYEAYAGDFPGAEKDAQVVLQLNRGYATGHLILAYAKLAQGQLPEATQTYEELQKLSPTGASISTLGLADLALYQGRISDAVKMLQSGAAADLAAKNSRAGEKFAALAYAHLYQGSKSSALDAAKRALSNSDKVNIRFLMGRIFVEAGETAKARALATALATDVSPEAQADAKLLEGETALHEKDIRKAVQLFTEANNVLDTWMGRFDLGRAYLQAGQFVEADSEFDRCIKRRGEALELFDGPTYGYFPPVYYYQGRVREGLKSAGSAESYRTYLDIRGKSNEDPLLPEIRRRLGQ
jgi:tetratricopeptide (TPR) repeat protein/predicted Ser/Thr protein kinase